jgi:exo-beta-1,3-glucanase (GH17 family)
MISFYQYEAVKIDLENTQSQLSNLKTQMSITIADKDSLFSNLMDVKNSLVFVMANIDKLYDKTSLAVNTKMSVLEDKVIRVQDVIKETV